MVLAAESESFEGEGVADERSECGLRVVLDVVSRGSGRNRLLEGPSDVMVPASESGMTEYFGRRDSG